MITDRIELSPLPLFINIIYIFALFDFRDPFLKSPDNLLFGPEKLFYVCRFSIQDQSFNNFENDTKKLSVNEAKLTGL